MLGEAGNSTVDYVIATDGSVSDASIRTSSGSLRLDDAAIAFVKTFTFKPATLDGKPVACSRVIRVAWALSGMTAEDLGPISSFSMPALYPTKDDFPPGAVDRREEGTVFAMLIVSDKGSIDGALVMLATPFGDLNAATVPFLMKQKATAPTLNGKPVRTVVVVRVVWSLSPKPESPSPSGDRAPQ